MKRLVVVLLGLLSIFLLFACKKTVTIGTKSIDVSKNYTIFISQSNEKGTLDQMRKGFVKGMVEKGYVENVNVTYFYENAKGDKNVSSKIADLAIEKKPDMVVGIGEISINSLKEKISDIPIVFLGCADAERIGICDNEGMPLNNVTGVTDSHMLNESLKFITDNHAEVKKLGIIYDDNNKLSKYDVDYMKFYATGYDIDIYTVAIKKEADVGKALDNIIPKVDALFFTCDDMINKNAETILARCKSSNKSAFAVEGEVSGDGLIYTASPNKELVGYEAADISKIILSGESKVKDIKIRNVAFD